MAEKDVAGEDFTEKVVLENSLQQPNILTSNYRALIDDDSDLNIETEAMRYDPSGRYSAFVQKISGLDRSISETDPLQQVLQSLNVTNVAYRKGQTPEINWDYFRKNLDAKFVDEVKKLYEKDLQVASEVLSENSPVYKDLEATREATKEDYLAKIDELKKDAQSYIQVSAALDKMRAELVEFNNQMENLTTTDMLEEYPEVADKIEQDMLDHKWNIDEEDLPKFKPETPTIPSLSLPEGVSQNDLEGMELDAVEAFAIKYASEK